LILLAEFGTLLLNGIATDRVRRWRQQLARMKLAMATTYRLLRTGLTTAVDDALLSENSASASHRQTRQCSTNTSG
jgi:hypothetical protein